MDDPRHGDEPEELLDESLRDLLQTLAEERRTAGEAADEANRTAQGRVSRARGDDTPGSEASLRADLELLGLLPEALEERRPAPEARERLMAALRREGRPGAEGTDQPAVGPHRQSRTAPPGAHRPWAGTAPTTASTTPSSHARPPAFRPPAWFTALAAALLLAVVGLAAFSGWLYARLDHQQATIARLSEQLETTSGEAQRLAAVRADLEAHRLDLASRLSLVATPGTEVCPLRPLGDEPPYPQARGLLFLSGPRDEWYVRVANVEPAPEGRAYRLWFVLGDEVLPVGVLRPGTDGTVELAGSRLPPEDRMTAALVTLEPAARTPSRPTGPTVLYGDEKMDMI